MEQIILVVHLLIALAIIGLIMMQQGKGSDIGASFGAGASQTLFGSAGSANLLTRLTAWLAVFFFATSFGLAVIADSKTAGDEDLGFDLPEAMLVMPDDNVQDASPQGDVPSVEQVTPVIDAIDDAVVDDLPSAASGDVTEDLTGVDKP